MTKAKGSDQLDARLTDAHRLVHPRHRRRGRVGVWRHLGPGLITGAADDDPSGIGTYSQLGAQFGVGMLWTVPISFPLAAAVEELAARLGLAGKEGLAALIKRSFPRPALYGLSVLVAAANTFNVGADLGAMAASARLVVPIPFLVLLVCITGVLLFLEIVVTYHNYARLLRLLTLSLLAYIGVLAVVKVDWLAVASNLVVPHLSLQKEYIAGLVAILGTTISPYLMFWQCSEEVEETADRKAGIRITRTRILGMRVDVIAGMAAAVAIMFAIMVACAYTLGAHGAREIGTADQAAQALEPLAGNLAGLLFALGVIGTGSLAVPVLAGSTAYALSETFGWREGLAMRFREASGFYGVIIASMFAGLAMNLAGIEPIRALFYAALLNGLAAPPVIGSMLVLGNRAGAVGRHRSGWLSNLLVGFACLLMTALPLIYLALR
ncbi:MAG: divalent metal cation transporter [Chloroflexi bacterium]|nr:MAG: divalent metal cation transporter [Chloroflexota bacterium]